MSFYLVPLVVGANDRDPVAVPLLGAVFPPMLEPPDVPLLDAVFPPILEAPEAPDVPPDAGAIELIISIFDSHKTLSPSFPSSNRVKY